ncbi:MAG: cell division protein ZapA [Lishizhenia sp.]
MSKLSIKVVVAGRSYPLTVNEAEQEKINLAADTINKSIKKLQDNYAVKDMQDLLAMTALQLATKSTEAPQTPSVDEGELLLLLQEVADSLKA